MNSEADTRVLLSLPSNHANFTSLDEVNAFVVQDSGKVLSGNHLQRHYFFEQDTGRMCAVVRYQSLTALHHKRLMAYKNLCAVIVIHTTQPTLSYTVRVIQGKSDCRLYACCHFGDCTANTALF